MPSLRPRTFPYDVYKVCLGCRTCNNMALLTKNAASVVDTLRVGLSYVVLTKFRLFEISKTMTSNY